MVSAVLIRLCGAALALLVASAAAALPTRSFERAEVFATCAGRLAALSAHQSAYDEPRPGLTDGMIETFEALLEAVLPDALAEGVPEDQAGKWRSGGWSEVAALLSIVHYSFDARKADRAELALAQRLAECTRLLLPEDPAGSDVDPLPVTHHGRQTN